MFDGGVISTTAEHAASSLRLRSAQEALKQAGTANDEYTDTAHLEVTLRPPAWRVADDQGRQLTGTPAAAMQALMNTLETVRCMMSGAVFQCIVHRHQVYQFVM